MGIIGISFADASSIANVIMALMNVLLVLYVHRQLKMHEKFYNTQSKRDAQSKISNAYQRYFADMMAMPKLVTQLFPNLSPDQAENFVARGYLINTLNLEYRYASAGVHDYEGFIGSANYFLKHFKDTNEVTMVIELVRNAGFSREFQEIVLSILEKHLDNFRRQPCMQPQLEEIKV